MSPRSLLQTGRHICVSLQVLHGVQSRTACSPEVLVLQDRPCASWRHTALQRQDSRLYDSKVPHNVNAAKNVHSQLCVNMTGSMSSSVTSSPLPLRFNAAPENQSRFEKHPTPQTRPSVEGGSEPQQQQQIDNAPNVVASGIDFRIRLPGAGSGLPDWA